MNILFIRSMAAMMALALVFSPETSLAVALHSPPATASRGSDLRIVISNQALVVPLVSFLGKWARSAKVRVWGSPEIHAAFAPAAETPIEPESKLDLRVMEDDQESNTRSWLLELQKDLGPTDRVSFGSLDDEALLRQKAAWIVKQHRALREARSLLLDYSKLLADATEALKARDQFAVYDYGHRLQRVGQKIEKRLELWPATPGRQRPWRDQVALIEQAIEFWANPPKVSQMPLTMVLDSIAWQLEDGALQAPDEFLFSYIGFTPAAHRAGAGEEFSAFLRLAAYHDHLKASSLSSDLQRRVWLDELVRSMEAGEISALTAVQWWEQPPHWTGTYARELVEDLQDRPAVRVSQGWVAQHEAQWARVLTPKRAWSALAAGVVFYFGLFLYHVLPSSSWITPEERAASALQSKASPDTVFSGFSPDVAFDELVTPDSSDSSGSEGPLSREELTQQLKQVETEIAQVQKKVNTETRRVETATRGVDAARQKREAVEKKWIAPVSSSRESARENGARFNGSRIPTEMVSGPGLGNARTPGVRVDDPSSGTAMPTERDYVQVVSFDRPVSGFIETAVYEQFNRADGTWRQTMPDPSTTQTVRLPPALPVNTGHMSVASDFEALLIPPGYEPVPDAFTFSRDHVRYDVRQDANGVFFLWILDRDVSFPLQVHFGIAPASQPNDHFAPPPSSAAIEPMETNAWQSDTALAVTQARRLGDPEVQVRSLVSYIRKTSEYVFSDEVTRQHREPPDHLIANLDRVKVSLGDQQYRALVCADGNSWLVALVRELGLPAVYMGGYEAGAKSTQINSMKAHGVVLVFYSGAWHMFDATPPDRDSKESKLFTDLPVAQEARKEQMETEEKLSSAIQQRAEAAVRLAEAEEKAEALRQKQKELTEKLKELNGGVSMVIAPISDDPQEHGMTMADRLAAIEGEWKEPPTTAEVMSVLAREATELERAKVAPEVRPRYQATVVEQAMRRAGKNEQKPLQALYWTFRAQTWNDPAADHPWVIASQRNTYKVVEKTSIRLVSQDEPYPHGGVALPAGTPPAPSVPKEPPTQTPLRLDGSGSFPKTIPAGVPGARNQVQVLLGSKSTPRQRLSWVQGKGGVILGYSDGHQIYDLQQRPYLFPPQKGDGVMATAVSPDLLPFAFMQIGDYGYLVNLLTGEANSLDQPAENADSAEMLFDDQGTVFIVTRWQGSVSQLLRFKQGHELVEEMRNVPLSESHLVRHRGHVYVYSNSSIYNQMTLFDLTANVEIRNANALLQSATSIKVMTDPFKTDTAVIVAARGSSDNAILDLDMNPIMSWGVISSLDNFQFNETGGYSFTGYEKGRPNRAFYVIPEEGSDIFRTPIQSGSQVLGVYGETSYISDAMKEQEIDARVMIRTSDPKAISHGPFIIPADATVIATKEGLIISLYQMNGRFSIYKITSTEAIPLSSDDAETVSQPMRWGDTVAFMEKRQNQWSLRTIEGDPVSSADVVYADAKNLGTMLISARLKAVGGFTGYWKDALHHPVWQAEGSQYDGVSTPEGHYYRTDTRPTELWKASGDSVTLVKKFPTSIVRMDLGPDGLVYVLTHDKPNEWTIWQAGKDDPVYRVPVSQVHRFAFGPDRNLYVLTMEGSRLTLLNVTQGTRRTFTMPHDGSPSLRLFFTPQGQAVVTVHEDKHAHVLTPSAGTDDSFTDQQFPGRIRFIESEPTTDESYLYVYPGDSSEGFVVRLSDNKRLAVKGIPTFTEAFSTRDGRLLASNDKGQPVTAVLLPNGDGQTLRHGGKVLSAMATTMPLVVESKKDIQDEVEFFDVPNTGEQKPLASFSVRKEDQSSAFAGVVAQTGPEGTAIDYVPLPDDQFALLFNSDRETTLALEQAMRVMTTDPETARSPEFRNSVKALIEGRVPRTRGPVIPAARRIQLYLASEGLDGRVYFLKTLQSLKNQPLAQEEARRELARIVVTRFASHQKAFGAALFNLPGLRGTGRLSELLNQGLIVTAQRHSPWRLHERPADRELLAFSHQVEQLMNDVPYLRLTPSDLKGVWRSPAQQGVDMGWEAVQQTFFWLLLMELFSAGLGVYAHSQYLRARRSFDQVAGAWEVDREGVFGIGDFPIEKEMESLAPRERSLLRHMTEAVLLVPGVRYARDMRAAERVWRFLSTRKDILEPLVEDRISLPHFLSLLSQRKQHVQDLLAAS